MKNKELANLFLEIKQLLELKGENPFKIRSYEKAADTIMSLTGDIKQIAERGELLKIPGIGKGISGKITEYVKTGEINELEKLKKEIPAGLVQMLKISGLGPNKIRHIRETLHIESMRGLEIAARRGDLAGIPGFAEKTERNILRGIEMVTRMSGRFLLPTAEETANGIITWLGKNEKCSRALTCGSYRRGCDTIGDIDILAVSDEPQALIDEFTKRDDVEKVFA
ncbi:MAG: helix-hairpin-helix domain-containing protein, partial [bacterium]